MKLRQKNQKEIDVIASSMEIKEEPIYDEQTTFINEREFDEFSKEGKRLLDIARPEENRVWAQVVSVDRKEFLFNCSQCLKVYPLPQWQEFIDHINVDHNPTEPRKAPTPTMVEIEISTNAISEIVNSFEDDNGGEPFYPSDSSSSENCMEPDLIVEQKLQEECSQKADQPTSNNSSEKKRAKNTKVQYIFFNSPKKKLVDSFLHMIKENPMLWHGRHMSKKLFDETIRNCLPAFNMQHKSKYTEGDVQASIKRMKTAAKRPNFGRKFSGFQRLWREIEEAADEMLQKCDTCPSVFFKALDLRVHKFKVHDIGEMPFKCSKCDFTCAERLKLDEHEKRHKLQEFTCEVCQKVFNYQGVLKKHMAVHAGVVCEVCGQKFDNQSKLSQHKVKHQAKTKKCNLCDKVYHTKFELQEHKKSHYNRREYECQHCDKAYNTRRALSIHMRTAHKMKLPCEEPQSRWIWVTTKELNSDHNDNTSDASSNDESNIANSATAVVS